MANDVVRSRDWSVMTDEELIVAHRVGTGDSDGGALSELFRRYQPHLARWCVRFTQDRDSALDLSQDILFRAYRSLHTFRGDARFSTWLYVIARNQCASAVQRCGVQPAHLDPAVAETVADAGSFDIHGALEAEQLRARVSRLVIGALTAIEARVMMLHYGEDVPLRDITRALGLRNKSGAKAYIVSARRKLSSLVRQSRTSRAFASAPSAHERAHGSPRAIRKPQ